MITERRVLSRSKTLLLIDELQVAEDPAISLYIPPNMPLCQIEQTLKKAAVAVESISEAADIAAGAKNGAVLLWGEQRKYLILPPFPVEENQAFSGYDVQSLRELLQRELVIALILLRLGAYAIGVFRGEKLLSSKVGTGLIHARHKKGGSSQRRFERGREKQMEYFFSRICNHARDHLEPHIRQLDYLYYGGERYTLLSFRKQCEFLKLLDDRASTSLLNVREPKQSTLTSAINQVWCSEVIEYKEIC